MGRSGIKKLSVDFLQVSLAIGAFIAFYQLGVTSEALPQLIDVKTEFAELSRDFSLAYASAWLFNLLVVVLPEAQKRRATRSWLNNRYVALKDDLVRQYFGLIGYSYEQEEIEQLRDPVAFSQFFSKRFSDDQNRWHAVHNALYEWGLPEIRTYCQGFVSDCDLAVGLVGELNPESERLLRSVRHVLQQATLAEPDYQLIKNLLFTLYQLHCPWSVLDGKTYDDSLMKTINRI